MFLPEFTRGVAITREVVASLSGEIQDTVYGTFVKFMAQRPEIPGLAKLLLRLNKSNAQSCKRWLALAGISNSNSLLSDQDRRDAKAYARSYVDRNVPLPVASPLEEEEAAAAERHAFTNLLALRLDLENAVTTCVECTFELLGHAESRRHGGQDRRNKRMQVYTDPLKTLAMLADKSKCVQIARKDLAMVRELTPAYDCISVIAMFRSIKVSAFLSETSHKFVKDAGHRDSDFMHSVCEIVRANLGLLSVQVSADHGHMGSQGQLALTVGKQPREVVADYVESIQTYFDSVPCRILIVSDFSEECDDEIAFELLIRACNSIQRYCFTIDLWIPDARERISWFKHIFKSHFEQSPPVFSHGTVPSTPWKRIQGKTHPTPFMFTAGANTTVRVFCTEGAKRARVVKKIPDHILRAYPVTEAVPDHRAIPQREALHYFLWNAPVPEEVPPAWFAGFHNTRINSRRPVPHGDGILRVIQIGGPGSVNSKPDRHFQAVLAALDGSKAETSTVMFLKEVTRKVPIKRNLVSTLPAAMQEAVFSNFTKFMAKRPEFSPPGNPTALMIRLNTGNADMCREWRLAAGGGFLRLTVDQKAEVDKWARAYVQRRAPLSKGAQEDEQRKLFEAVKVCVTCTLELLTPEGYDPLRIYTDPTHDLSKLRDEPTLINRARYTLTRVQELTPAYDCVAVIAMLRHLEAGSKPQEATAMAAPRHSWSGSQPPPPPPCDWQHCNAKKHWRGLDVVSLLRYTGESPAGSSASKTGALSSTFCVPGQPDIVVRGFVNMVDTVLKKKISMTRLTCARHQSRGSDPRSAFDSDDSFIQSPPSTSPPLAPALRNASTAPEDHSARPSTSTTAVPPPTRSPLPVGCALTIEEMFEVAHKILLKNTNLDLDIQRSLATTIANEIHRKQSLKRSNMHTAQ